MKILDVRDGFIKFEADKDICLSSFIQINGMAKSYVAQVIQLKTAGENPIAYAKILFLYDGDLMPYDKTLPSSDSEIKEFTFEILDNSIIKQNPVIAGKTLNHDVNITIDASAFNKKMLISVDDKDENNVFVRNLTKQFNNLKQKVVIIDTLGVIQAKKFVAGVDFKLPLDTHSLSFMYTECLNDATSDSKSLIMDIFKDLAEYSKTVEFLPFEVLKNIVDDMVDNSHVFKLLVLKNKLAKFKQLGYFATTKEEVKSFENILNAKCSIIDLSKLDSVFQNRYLSFVYEVLSKQPDTQVLFELSNTVSKGNIKSILDNEQVKTTFITHSKFKYLNDIKNIFDNFIIVPSFANNQIFSIFSSFLKSMPKNSYLIAGEATNYIPFVSPLKLINDVISFEAENELEINEEENREVIEEQNNDENLLETVAVGLNEDDIATNNEIPSSVDEDEKEEPEVVESIEPEIVTESEIIDELSDEDIEAASQTVVEEIPVQMSEEEILTNITEKSNSVISQAIEDVGQFSSEISMFEDSQNEDNDDSENVVNEIYAQEEAIEEYESVPLTESFDSDELTQAEIVDYEPNEQAENAVLDEISLTQELAETELIDLENKPEELSYEEVELPAGVDLELNNEEDNSFDSFTEDSLENEPLEELTDFSAEEDIGLQVTPLGDDSEFDDIVELDPLETDENDIIIDMEDEPAELPEDIDEQIVKDVDKVFTTRRDDEISDSDLDFIDELNSDDTEILEEVSDSDTTLEELAEADDDGILEETPVEEFSNKQEIKEENEILQTKNSATPIVPIYNADIPPEDMVESDPIQQGDLVVHTKYGTGVVEKMIKYGNKTLYSINFDNIGRRLLDPTLTEIKKA